MSALIMINYDPLIIMILNGAKTVLFYRLSMLCPIHFLWKNRLTDIKHTNYFDIFFQFLINAYMCICICICMPCVLCDLLCVTRSVVLNL